MKRRTRLDILAILFGVALLALLAYGRQEAQRQPAPSIYSTYDAGPNGYLALYDVLHGAGVPVTRFEHVLGLLDSKVGTLVFTTFENDPNAKPMTGNDVTALRRFVQNGGRLVVLDTDFAGSRDVTPAAATSSPSTSHDAVALARTAFTAGVRSVAGPVDAVFPFRQKRGLPLLANDAGVAATWYAFGKGEIIAITAPRLFGNAYLAKSDNIAFAYNVFHGHGPVAFDEYVHGYDDDTTFWAALPLPVKTAFWTICAVVLLALLGANVPFAPPIPAEPPDERDSGAYVTAMAGLMRRARAARAAVAIFVADASRRSRRSNRTTDVAHAIAELDSLKFVAHPTDAQLLRAAILDYSIRKDYA